MNLRPRFSFRYRFSLSVLLFLLPQVTGDYEVYYGGTPGDYLELGCFLQMVSYVLAFMVLPPQNQVD